MYKKILRRALSSTRRREATSVSLLLFTWHQKDTKWHCKDCNLYLCHKGYDTVSLPITKIMSNLLPHLIIHTQSCKPLTGHTLPHLSYHCHTFSGHSLSVTHLSLPLFLFPDLTLVTGHTLPHLSFTPSLVIHSLTGHSLPLSSLVTRSLYCPSLVIHSLSHHWSLALSIVPHWSFTPSLVIHSLSRHWSLALSIVPHW